MLGAGAQQQQAAGAAPAAAAAALNQDQVRDILARHDRIKKSTDLPLFYGRKDKDTCTARLLIDRFETAARIANWNNDQVRKCEEFYLIMRDRALIWWKSLQDIPDFPKDDNGSYNSWARVKEEFLAAYAIKYTARTACTNFQDLVQKSGENVQDFFLRVSEAYQRLRETKPPTIDDVRRALGGVDANEAAAFKKEGIEDMGRFFLHQLFLAGLKEDVRVKTMEAGHPTVQESLKTARETEAILKDKSSKSLISAVREGDELENDEFETFFSNYLSTKEAEDAELEPWEEQYLDKVNAIRYKKGKKPFRFGNRKFNRSEVTCRICKLKGHFQKDCRKRIREGKPMVDANGKPYSSESRANPIREEDYEEDDESSISALSYYGINSIRLGEENKEHLN